MKSFGSLLVPIVIVVLLYLFLLRPSQRQQKKQQQVQRELVPGERVMLGSGIHGTLTRVEEGRAWLEIAPGVEIEVERRAVVRREEPATDQDLTGSPLDAPNETEHPQGGEPAPAPEGGPARTGNESD